jgi:hypothetical protein
VTVLCVLWTAYGPRLLWILSFAVVGRQLFFQLQYKIAILPGIVVSLCDRNVDSFRLLFLGGLLFGTTLHILQLTILSLSYISRNLYVIKEKYVFGSLKIL